MKKLTKWLHIFKYRPHPDWGIWTSEFVGTNEEFEEMIKERKIELLGHKKHHFIPELPEIDKDY